MKLGIFLGGGKEESSISLNSARSIYDLIYKQCEIQNYSIELFYINEHHRIFIYPKEYIYSNNINDFSSNLIPIENFWATQKIDYAIPLIHGEFCEGGELISIFEKYNIPHLFSNSKVMKNTFDKYSFQCLLEKYNIQKSTCLKATESNLILMHSLHKLIILKTHKGGSSSGIFLSNSIEQSREICLNNKNLIIEKAYTGREFSIAVVNGKPCLPIGFDKHSIVLNARDKYFPSEQTRKKVPMEESLKVINTIQDKAKIIYDKFEFNDFVRMDGFIEENNELVFIECNVIPGCDINSLFWQSVSDDHFNVIFDILNKSLLKYNLPIFTNIQSNLGSLSTLIDLPILIGGMSNEKNISVISGANVLIKLRSSNKFNPIPFILYNNDIFKVPFYFVMKHSLEDIMYLINNIDKYNLLTNKNIKIQKYSLEQLATEYKQVFIALHGGIGEDGTIQKVLEKHNVKFNGSNSEISAICINKIETLNMISHLTEIKSIYRKLIDHNTDIKTLELPEIKLIIKPNNEGSSNNIFISEDINYIKNYLLTNKKEQCFIIEEYIVCDKLESRFINGSMCITSIPINGWIELTVGYYNETVLTPSITISDQGFLSSEEKFQEGLGINLTPPPNSIISQLQIKIIQTKMKSIYDTLNIKRYVRADIFFNRFSNELILIEINNLPALCSSTVLFSQLKVNVLEFLENC